MGDYYDLRAPEYDETSWGAADRIEREEIAALRAVIEGMSAVPTLDVGCGTGYLSRWLPGRVVGLDRSPRMLGMARSRLDAGVALVRGEATRLPFADRSFDRLVAANLYGHLEEPDRLAFLAEARRVGEELVIVDEARAADSPPDGPEERPLLDGSRHSVYKRRFQPEQLVDELGGGEVLLASRTFVVVRA